MDTPLAVAVRPLAPAELDTAAAVVNASGLSTPPDDLRRAASLSTSMLAGAWLGDELAGVAGAICYGSRGVIGPMSVLPDRQGRGIGTALLRYAMAWLERSGCVTLTLDATPAGAPLYRRHGFTTDFWMLHLVRPSGLAPAGMMSGRAGVLTATPMNSGSDAPIVTPADIGAGASIVVPAGMDTTVAIATPADIPTIDRFDAPIFGASRRTLLERYLADFPGRAVVARRSGVMRGYTLAQRQRLGPLEADGADVAADLLAAWMHIAQPDGAVVSLPGSNEAGLALLSGAGFVEMRRLERMRLGGAAHPGDPARIYGILSYAKG